MSDPNLADRDAVPIGMRSPQFMSAASSARAGSGLSPIIRAHMPEQNGASGLYGRTVAVVNDLEIEEQLQLYDMARRLKAAVKDGQSTLSFKLGQPETTIYSIFMENSTRTKESFINAGKFHGCKINPFDAETSSFQKRETITDTIKMLAGYSTGPVAFVMRTKLEGVCRWLEQSMAGFCKRHGMPPISFINAGDGRHEHPTQEFLDEFSFLEALSWNREEIHIALIGDLYHGRTVHSKADGLRIYKKVRVDLIAPDALKMPEFYKDVMRANGFELREFESLDDYLAQESVSKIWYFTRLQLERMGDQLLSFVDNLRVAISVRKDMIPRLPQGTRFFHPLPRDSKNPEIPFWLDNSEYNNWDAQSRNGYFVRISLLRLLLDRGVPHLSLDSLTETGSGAVNVPPPQPFLVDDQKKEFVEELPLSTERPREMKPLSSKQGILPVTDGLVIDHIAKGASKKEIWLQLDRVRRYMELYDVGASGVYPASEGKVKGIISLPNYPHEFDRKSLKKLAALAPGCTVNVIAGSVVQRKYRLHMPPRIYNFPIIQCSNTNCVSHPKNMQREVVPHFIRPNRGDGDSTVFLCMYCEHPHQYYEIWVEKNANFAGSISFVSG
jgi:aspartate carbamoyltransferase